MKPWFVRGFEGGLLGKVRIDYKATLGEARTAARALIKTCEFVEIRDRRSCGDTDDGWCVMAVERLR